MPEPEDVFLLVRSRGSNQMSTSGAPKVLLHPPRVKFSIDEWVDMIPHEAVEIRWFRVCLKVGLVPAVYCHCSWRRLFCVLPKGTS